MRSHATQYDETHEWFERCGVHGRPSHCARFGLMMNADASRSCAISTGAPIAKSRRIPAGMLAAAARVTRLQSQGPKPTQARAASTVAAISDGVRPAAAVNTAIAPRSVSVVQVNSANHRGTEDMT